MLPASVNGGTHVRKRLPLQFVINEIPFRKLFLKELLYSKFAVSCNVSKTKKFIRVVVLGPHILVGL